MTTLANNPMTRHATHAEAPSIIGQHLVIAWPCTRRTAAASRERLLERVWCIVAVHLLDSQRAAIECWIESEGARQRTVLHATTWPCATESRAHLLHVDIRARDGSRLLALTIDRSSQRMLFAQSALLHDAGFGGATYGPPTLRSTGEARVAQSA